MRTGWKLRMDERRYFEEKRKDQAARRANQKIAEFLYGPEVAWQRFLREQEGKKQ